MTINITKRIDFHTHTLLSDGVLTPSELVQRAVDKNYAAIAITDHADAGNLEIILRGLKEFKKYSSDHFGIKVICGVELTHVPPTNIAALAKKAKKGGAEIVVVHGETPVEPVMTGTNKAAIEAGAYVDILAHPGMITEECAELAAKNNVFIEITSRGGHNWTNGHVVKTCQKYGCKFLINTDTHSPGDMINVQQAVVVAKGAGLSEEEALTAINDNPQLLLKKLDL